MRVLLVPYCVFIADVAATFYTTQKQITDVLKHGYDHHMHPGQELGIATTIAAELYLMDVINIDIRENKIEIRLNFVQDWMDTRLRFNHLNYSSYIHRIEYSDKSGTSGWEVWRPKISWSRCSKPKVVQDEYMVKPDGRVGYEQVLELSCECFYNIRQLPFDNHVCKIPMIGWDGLTADEVRFVESKALSRPNVENAEYYDFAAACWVDQFIIPFSGKREMTLTRAVLEISFSHKHQGDVIAIILPAALFAFVAWGNFYIEEAPPRVAVSVTSTLVLFTLLGKAETKLPFVTTECWMVVFLYGCVCFNFATIFLLFFTDFALANAPKEKAEDLAHPFCYKRSDRILIWFARGGRWKVRWGYLCCLLLYFIVIFSCIPAFETTPDEFQGMSVGFNKVPCGAPSISP